MGDWKGLKVGVPEGLKHPNDQPESPMTRAMRLLEAERNEEPQQLHAKDMLTELERVLAVLDLDLGMSADNIIQTSASYGMSQLLTTRDMGGLTDGSLLRASYFGLALDMFLCGALAMKEVMNAK